jgi:hypothetical protein
MRRTLLWALPFGALACSSGKFGTMPDPRNDAGGPARVDASTVDTAGAEASPPPVACETLHIATLPEFETRFLLPRCGTVPAGVADANCHSSVFFPKNLDKPGMVRASLVDQPGQMLCKGDKYINRADITRSYLLAKVSATGDVVECPSGGNGGARMPDQAVTPKPPLLSADERACLMWYVTELAK